MAALERFVGSPSGSLAYRMAQHYGTDPLPFGDDVLGFNVRAALALTYGTEPPEPTFEEQFG